MAICPSFSAPSSATANMALFAHDPCVPRLCYWQILTHAFTSDAGKRLGMKVQDESTYVATKRCGFLMACAIFHKLDEVRLQRGSFLCSLSAWL